MPELTSIVKNLVNEPTQVPEDESVVHLTVNRIGKLVKPGALDFGGSEYTEATVKWLEPKKRDPEDKYGWWELDQGLYRIEFNESLEIPEGTRVQLQIWSGALRNGILHPAQIIERSQNPLGTQIHVSESEVGIKENARLSEVRLA